MATARLLGISPHGVLHGQGGIAGPHSMILVRNGGAEERHNPIAHDLVYGPFVPVHRGHHAFQYRID
jgi:hypothetical protein